MGIDLTSEEKRLLEYAKEAIVKYNKIRHANDGIDTLYSFLLPDSGTIHDGACYEPNLAHAHGMRNESELLANEERRDLY